MSKRRYLDDPPGNILPVNSKGLPYVTLSDVNVSATKLPEAKATNENIYRYAKAVDEGKIKIADIPNKELRNRVRGVPIAKTVAKRRDETALPILGGTVGMPLSIIGGISAAPYIAKFLNNPIVDAALTIDGLIHAPKNIERGIENIKEGRYGKGALDLGLTALDLIGSGKFFNKILKSKTLITPKDQLRYVFSKRESIPTRVNVDDLNIEHSNHSHLDDVSHVDNIPNEPSNNNILSTKTEDLIENVPIEEYPYGAGAVVDKEGRTIHYLDKSSDVDEFKILNESTNTPYYVKTKNGEVKLYPHNYRFTKKKLGDKTSASYFDMSPQEVKSKLIEDFNELPSGNKVALTTDGATSADSQPLFIMEGLRRKALNQGEFSGVLDDSGDFVYQMLNDFAKRDKHGRHLTDADLLQRQIDVYNKLRKETGMPIPEPFIDNGAIFVPSITFKKFRNGGFLRPSLKNGGIYIKPSHRGRLTALKERTGHSTTWFKENGTPAQKKMATFALNAAKWKH